MHRGSRRLALVIAGIGALPVLQAVEPSAILPPAENRSPPMAEAEIRVQNGKPVIVVNGEPIPFVAYSPVAGRRPAVFRRQTARFFAHAPDVFLLTPPEGKLPPEEPWEWAPSLFWRGDTITGEPLLPPAWDFDADVQHILEGHPNAWLLLRSSPDEPRSWRKLHPDELFVNDLGERLECPSLASDLFTEMRGQATRAWIGWYERRPWAHRIIGYWNGDRVEGSHQPLIEGWLFDHSPVMLAKWRAFLREKYKTVEALRAAHGVPDADFETYDTPRDRNRGPVPLVERLPFWPSEAAVRDYLELSRDLYHARLRRLAADTATATLGRKRILVYDCLKQWMQGWSNWGFFDAKTSWPWAFPDVLAGSGHISVAPLLTMPGFDGLITPHDYQARGIGGVYENEGITDSLILRGRLFLSEMDTRTWTGRDPIFPARDLQEFKAITWRNLATAWSRGFLIYWMDVYEDWFADPAMHETVIAPQTRAIRQALHWEHATEPGIAVILDDSAALDADPRGNYLNEAVLWEVRQGLARCGVPHRIYLPDDLALPNFPEHRLFWFPNLFRVDARKRALLEKVVLRNGHVAVWGPATGISDGARASAEAAAAITGLQMELLEVNLPRRVLISNFAHPITRNLPAGLHYGSALSYGPVLVPLDGDRLGEAWLHRGLLRSGLSVKTFGRGAGRGGGPGDWASVFTVALGLPAPLWRELARWAGAHVWCESDDVIIASRSVAALHTLKGGPRSLRLPWPADVTDVITDQPVGRGLHAIEWTAPDVPDTRVFHLRPVP